MYQNNESFESSNSSFYNVEFSYQPHHRLSPLSNSLTSSNDSSFAYSDSTNNYYSNWYNTYYNNYGSNAYSSPNGYYGFSQYSPYQYCYNSQSLQESPSSSDSLKSSPVSSIDQYSKTYQKFENKSAGNVSTTSNESTSIPPRITTKSSSVSRKHQLPDKAVDILNEWFDEHIQNPYPSLDDKERLAKAGGISVKQVNAWFSNRRNRSQNTKPKRMKRVIENEFNNIVNVLSVNTTYNYDEYKQQIIENFKKHLSRENF